MQKPEKAMSLGPDRIIERGRGCWNCKSYENGDIAKEHYKSCVAQDIMTLKKEGRLEVTRLGDGEPDIKRVQQLIVKGFSQSKASEIASQEAERAAAMSRFSSLSDGQVQEQTARFQIFNQQIQDGKLGICRIGKNVGSDGKIGEFVAHKFLCDDGWSGVDGASMATEGKPLDLPTLELKDKIDNG